MKQAHVFVSAAALAAHHQRQGAAQILRVKHGLGFARALEISGDHGMIWLPENAVPSKVEALRHYAVELAFPIGGVWDTLVEARASDSRHVLDQRISVAQP